LSRPSVPCPTEQDLARMTNGRPIGGFKKRCPGEPSDYRKSPGTATYQNPDCQKTTLPARKGEQSSWSIQEALPWRGRTVEQVPERRSFKGQRPRYIEHRSKQDKEQSRGHQKRNQ